MSSPVEICNRALQKLGAKRITSFDQDSPNARSCAVAYEKLKKALLRKHPWVFASTRVALPADTQAPAFGYQYQYQLPADYLRLLPLDRGYVSPEENYQIEGTKILTNDLAPLQIRYVRNTDENFDPLFEEALASYIAMELCEEITQSNTKMQSALQSYKDAIAEAKRTNAIEQIAAEPPEDTWVSRRC